jgi:hypothetical protein
MDAHEQRVIAADMLTGARKVDGGNAFPPHVLIADFQDGLDNVCSVTSVGEQSMAEMGAFFT